MVFGSFQQFLPLFKSKGLINDHSSHAFEFMLLAKTQILFLGISYKRLNTRGILRRNNFFIQNYTCVARELLRLEIICFTISSLLKLAGNTSAQTSIIFLPTFRINLIITKYHLQKPFFAEIIILVLWTI